MRKFIDTWRIMVALSGNMNGILVDKLLKSVAGFLFGIG